MKLKLGITILIATTSTSIVSAQSSHSTNSVEDAVLNTFISDSIQIDQRTPGSLSPEDANLFQLLDPADNSPSYNVPSGGPGTYIDWDNLGNDLANHRLRDLDNAQGKDPTSFPLSNECVGTSQVLSKMDLTYIASANNSEFAYFAVQRANNNGDAGYYWLFTKKTPHMNAGEAPCKPSQSRLLYDISGPAGGSSGDVLLAGHFHPNGTPLLRVFHAKKNLNNVSAVNAIDFTDGTLWQEDSDGVAAVAINTTITAPGTFGAAGVLALTGSNVNPEIFAEAAVPLSVFTGGTACATSFYGSVITRSSGAGGTSPDLKDLAGPALFNFGGITASAKLTPTCGLSVGYEASALGVNGQPVSNPQCEWTFDDNTTSTTCSSSQNFQAGSHTGTVKVTDPASGCSESITTAAVNVYNPLAVTPALTGSCDSKFTYGATVTGGSNPSGASFAWAFSGGGTTNPSTSTATSGTVNVGTGGVSYTGNITVTDSRTDGLTCTATGSDSVTPFAPLAVNLGLVAPAPACPTMASDAVSYKATASGGGGSGGYTYEWSDVLCTGDTCAVDPSDSSFCFSKQLTVRVSDSSGCAAVTSAPASYTKSTVINATTTATMNASLSALLNSLNTAKLK